MTKYNSLLCPTTWDKYMMYHEATVNILGLYPERSIPISLVKVAHVHLKLMFDEDPSLDNLAPAITKDASQALRPLLPDGIVADTLVKHVLIYYILKAVPHITDRLFISPEGELLEGAIEPWMDSFLVTPKDECGERGWRLDEVTIVDPGDEVKFTFALERTVTGKCEYGIGTNPGMMSELAWEYVPEYIAVNKNDCNAITAKAEVAK